MHTWYLSQTPRTMSAGHCPWSNYFYVEQVCYTWKVAHALWRKNLLNLKSNFAPHELFCLSCGAKLAHMTSNCALHCLYHHDLCCFDTKICIVVLYAVLMHYWFWRDLRTIVWSKKSSLVRGAKMTNIMYANVLSINLTFGLDWLKLFLLAGWKLSRRTKATRYEKSRSINMELWNLSSKIVLT